MANNRLTQLLKQRALIEEHLSWLESEIDALQSANIETPENDPLENAIPANRLKSGEALGSVEISNGRFTDEPDPKTVVSDLYDKLGPDSQSSVKDARKGCVMIFGTGFLLLAAIAAWVWLKY